MYSPPAMPREKEGVILSPARAGEQQQGGEKKGKKRKGGGKDNAEKRVFNMSMADEFKMKDGEDWRKHQSGKLPKD